MVFSLRTFVKVFAISLALGLPGTLWASMIVDNAIINFLMGDPSRKDVNIKNPDAEPLYVDIEILEIINPGAPNEERRKVINPKEAGFLVTPDRLVIPPGGDKQVRLVNLKPLSDKERIFRVSLVPVAADVEAEQTGVKILVGYQLLVMISTVSPKAVIKGVREGNKLILTNEGNVNALLSRGEQCGIKAIDKTATDDCVELKTVRLYPGNKVEVELKYNAPVTYLSTSGVSNQNLSF